MGWVGKRPGRLLQENSPNTRQVSLFSLFLFEKFLLLKPATPYKSLSSHSAQFANQTWDYLGQGLSWPNSQLSPASAHSLHWVLTAQVCLPLRPYSLPCNFKQPGLSRCCSDFVCQGREPLTWWVPGLGLQPPWFPHWTQGPYYPEALSLPSGFSMSSTIFDLQSSYMLGYCWLFALFLRQKIG